MLLLRCAACFPLSPAYWKVSPAAQVPVLVLHGDRDTAPAFLAEPRDKKDRELHCRR